MIFFHRRYWDFTNTFTNIMIHNWLVNTRVTTSTSLHLVWEGDFELTYFLVLVYTLFRKSSSRLFGHSFYNRYCYRYFFHFDSCCKFLFLHSCTWRMLKGPTFPAWLFLLHTQCIISTVFNTVSLNFKKFVVSIPYHYLFLQARFFFQFWLLMRMMAHWIKHANPGCNVTIYTYLLFLENK